MVECLLYGWVSTALRLEGGKHRWLVHGIAGYLLTQFAAELRGEEEKQHRLWCAVQRAVRSCAVPCRAVVCGAVLCFESDFVVIFALRFCGVGICDVYLGCVLHECYCAFVAVCCAVLCCVVRDSEGGEGLCCVTLCCAVVMWCCGDLCVRVFWGFSVLVWLCFFAWCVVVASRGTCSSSLRRSWVGRQPRLWCAVQKAVAAALCCVLLSGDVVV